jgi:hypothetical protein
MAKRKNPVPTGDRQRGGDGAASASLIAQNAPEGPAYWEEVAKRRISRPFILDPKCSGPLPFAVVSYCEFNITSLHPTLNRARKVKAELDFKGCARGVWDICKGRLFHKIHDLRKPVRRPKL